MLRIWSYQRSPYGSNYVRTVEDHYLRADAEERLAQIRERQAGWLPSGVPQAILTEGCPPESHPSCIVR